MIYFMAGMLALAGEYLDIVPCGIYIFSNPLPYKKVNSERQPLEISRYLEPRMWLIDSSMTLTS